MLSDHRSIFFQTELRFLPIEELGFDKTFVRSLYAKLAEPGGYAYDDLSMQDGRPSMSTRRVTQAGVGMSTCKIGPHSILIEEGLPTIGVDEFIEVVQTVMQAVGETSQNAPGMFSQKCTIQCVSKPQGSEHSILLLAGRVSNVLDKIEPFGRPPAFFGMRFRFPPYHKADSGESDLEADEDDGDEAGESDRHDFVSVRFETWSKDVEQVFMEITAVNFFREEIGIDESGDIVQNIRDAYSFLTEKCVAFLNQFDQPREEPRDDE